MTDCYSEVKAARRDMLRTRQDDGQQRKDSKVVTSYSKGWKEKWRNNNEEGREIKVRE